MKLTKTLISAAVVILAAFAACKKDNNTSTSGNPNLPNNPNSSGDFTAMVNGTQFSSTKVTAEEEKPGVILIKATSGKTGFTVYITNPSVGPHTVTLAPGGDDYTNAVGYQTDTTTDDYYISDLNTVIQITAFDATAQTISGTFSLGATNETSGQKIQLTNGSFHVKYKKSGGNLSYTIDGQQRTEPVKIYKGFQVTSVDSAGTPKDSLEVFYFYQDTNGSTSYPALNLVFPTNLQNGTYDIKYTPSFPFFRASLQVSSQAYYFSGDLTTTSIGTLQITKNASGNVAGTFNMTLTSDNGGATKTLTNGSFDVKY